MQQIECNSTLLGQEMQSWLAALQANLNAEFPYWETCQSFKVFNLRPEFQKQATWPELVGCIRRLSKQFGLDPEEAVEEYRITRPLATRRSQAVGESNMSAWKLAIDGIEDRHKRGSSTGKRHLKSLRKLVALWMSMTFSTCGTEHLFSHSERLFPRRRSRLAVSKRRSELVLIFGQTPLPALAQKAGDVWLRVFRGSRQRLLVRSDKGCKRGPRKHLQTWASINKKRSAAVQSLKKDFLKSKHPMDAFQATSQNAGAEVELQKRRLAEKTFAAKSQGLLLDEDLQAPCVKGSLKLARKCLGGQKAPCKAPQTKPEPTPRAERPYPLASGPLRGHAASRAKAEVKNVYVDPGATVDRHLLRHYTIVQEPLKADLCIVNLGAGESASSSLAAWLVGARLDHHAAWQRNPPSSIENASIKFAAAICIRVLYLHFGAELQQNSFYRLIRAACQLGISKWRIVHDRPTLDRWKRARPKQTFMVVSVGRFQALPESQRDGVISLPHFLQSIKRVEASTDGFLRRVAGPIADCSLKLCMPSIVFQIRNGFCGTGWFFRPPRHYNPGSESRFAPAPLV